MKMPVILKFPYVNEVGENTLTNDKECRYRNRIYEDYLKLTATPEEVSENDKYAAFSCPITGNFFQEPVITPSGYTYEQAALFAWLDENPTDPIARIPLEREELRSNNEILELTNRLIADNPEYARQSRGTGDIGREGGRTFEDLFKAVKLKFHGIFHQVNEEGENITTNNADCQYRNRTYDGYLELLSRNPERVSVEDMDALFSCPITQDIFQDPVITPYGYTYERTACLVWLASHNTDPVNRQPLTDESELRVNTVIRELTDSYIDRNPGKSRGAGDIGTEGGRTFQDVFEDFQSRVHNVFSQTADFATAPLQLLPEGSRQCSQGNTAQGSTYISVGATYSAVIAANPVPAAALFGTTTVAGTAAATTIGTVDACNVACSPNGTQAEDQQSCSTGSSSSFQRS